jgi:hypothetical protein
MTLSEHIRAVFAPDAIIARALEILAARTADAVEIRRVIDDLVARYSHPLVADRLVSALRDRATALTPAAIKRPPPPGKIMPRDGLRRGEPAPPKQSNVRSAAELVAKRAASAPQLKEWPQ